MAKLIKIKEIQGVIIELRGKKVIIDRDLAMIYRVTTKRLNEQVKRNIERFPDDFMFPLTEEEKDEVVANCDHLRALKYSPQLPYAFTRNGANMVSTVLKSPVAIRRSIQIMRAFTVLEVAISHARRRLTQSPAILKKLSTHSRAIMRLFHESNAHTRETTKIKKIQREMINLLQQIVFTSIR